MKVLNVDVTIDPDTGGGCAERSFQMNRALAKRGVDCSLLLLDIGLTEERIKGLGSVKVHVLPVLLKRFYIPRISMAKLGEIVKDADIIHLMGHWEVTDAFIYLLSRHYQKPYVNCPAGSISVYGRSRLVKRFYNNIIGKRIVRNASKLIAISQDEFDHFKRYGVHPSRMEWIPNGINFEDYETIDDEKFRGDYGLSQNPFILFLGRLNAIKGPDLLLEAFNRVKDSFPHYHLVYAGPDRGMLKSLEEMAGAFGIKDRVHFTGHLGSADKSMAIHAANMMVIPSRSEAMSIVVLEAGATATPVLVTDQCGMNEISDIGGGRVVPASADGIKEGLLEMLSSSEKLGSMGESLKRYVYDRFTWDSLVERYIELYERILAEEI